MDEDIIRGITNNDAGPLNRAIEATENEITELENGPLADLNDKLVRLRDWHINFFSRPSPSARDKTTRVYKKPRKIAPKGVNLTKIIDFLTAKPQSTLREIADGTGIISGSVGTVLNRQKHMFVGGYEGGWQRWSLKKE